MAKRQDIVDAVIARMKTIVTPAYNINIGENVFEYRPSTQTLEDHELPAINLYDETESKGDEFAGNPPKINRMLDVVLEMLLKEGSSSINAARAGLADMEKAVGSNITFGGKALYTDFLGSTITKKQDTNIVTGVQLRIRVWYRTDKWAQV